jgi:endoribonuclease Dicer
MTSVALYCQYPNADQAELTHLRMKMINNAFLAERAQAQGLSTYLRAYSLSKGLEEIFHPPGHRSEYSLRNKNIQLQRGNSNDTNSSSDTTILSEDGQYIEVEVGYKTLADMFEAVLGAVYIHNQSDIITSKFLEQFKILNFSYTNAIDIYTSSIDNTCQGVSKLSRNEIIELESLLDYNFIHPQFLTMAVTHKSSCVHYNYERLEYLGDAILDFIIIKHLYKVKEYVNEGCLTLEKMSRTRNSRLTKVALRLGLTKYIRSDNMFIYQSLVKLQTDPMEALLMDKVDDSNEEVEGRGNDEKKHTLKVLADVIEALFGAIYVDSGWKLDVVEEVVKSLGLFEAEEI